MRAALISFTDAGRITALKIERALTAAGCACRSAEGRGLLGGLAGWTRQAFSDSDAVIFISATGIAVRAIAPFLKSKTEDPAVVVVDERGVHAISLLSGHIGGANELTERIASAVGAEPVITTATDVNGLFAVDQWAREQSLLIGSMQGAKKVSAALLRGEKIGFRSDFSVEGNAPECLLPGTSGGIEVCLFPPQEAMLWLAPKALSLGVGCRKGVPAEAIAEAVELALSEKGLRKEMVKSIASIDIKKEEPGLLAYAASLGAPFQTFGAEELLSVDESISEFASSEFVRSVTGVDNVCERAAVFGCGGKGKPTLIVGKRAHHGVTVAAAAVLDEICLSFESGKWRIQ